MDGRTRANEPPAPPLVVGLGHEHRCDDRAGLEVVRRLRGRLGERARVEECLGGGIALLDRWRLSDRVFVVDAVRSGAPPGTVHRLEPAEGNWGAVQSPTSTHGLTLTEAIALAKGVGQLPRHLVVYGIEAENVDVGDAVSPEVARGIDEVVSRLVAEVETGLRPVARTPREAVHA